MKSISFLSLTVVAFVAAPLMARADAKPNFDDDAKPILSQQPGLIEYVESQFEVKDTGIAKIPGDDNHPPAPPYIFRARPRGSSGPYNLRLLIQPGPPGHVLGIVDITKVQLPHANSSSPQAPAAPVESQVPANNQPASANTQAPPPTQQPPPITSDTPSGPITNPTSAPAPSNQPGLTPPPDPAPTPH